MDDLLYNPDTSKFHDRFVGPKGSTEPYLYIVGEGPGKDEHEAGEPFVGEAGKVLHRIIDKAGVDESQIRFFNAVPYRPFQISDYGNIKNRTPTPAEIELYRPFLLADIRKTKPRVILAAGRSALLGLGIDEGITRAREGQYEFEGIPVFATWHPSYVMQNDRKSNSERAFNEAVKDLIRAWNFKEKDNAHVEYEVVDVQDWSRVAQDLDRCDTLVLDYEASGLNAYQHGFHLAGIALKGLGERKSYYIRFYDFWRSKEEFQPDPKLLAQIGSFLSRKHLIVFNMMYECAVTLNVFNTYLKNVTDLMLWNRMLGESGSLKDLAHRRLNITNWTSDVDEWNRITTKLFTKCAVTHKGNARSEMVFLSEGYFKKTKTDGEVEEISLDPPKTIEDITLFFLIKNKVTNWSELEEKLDKRELEVFNAFSELDTFISRFYAGKRKEEFCQRFFQLLRKRTEARDADVRYTDIPIEIIASYAVEDIVHTDGLYHSFRKEIEQKNLVRTAEVYVAHGRLGFEIASAGIAWDNQRAADLDRDYYKVAVDTLRKLLLGEKFRRILNLKEQDVLKIQTATKLDQLDCYFNPRSNHEKTKTQLSQLLVTARVRFLRMLYEIFKDWSPREPEERHKHYPVLYPLIDSILELDDPTERLALLDSYVENSDIIHAKVFNHPANRLEKWRDRKKQNAEVPERETITKFLAWDLPGTAADVMQDLFESFESILGTDLDDQSTWVDEFRNLVLFKEFKKVMKNHSTYVWGDLGRQSIALIDREDVGKLRQLRLPGHQEVVPNHKQWILETDWGVLTANTKRWKSGMHTIPADSELLDLRVSRFPDGLRVHWDYSQMELRVAAFLSKDPNLLGAFSRGEDVHLFIASKVWKKPPDQVSKDERRYSKSATFAILYGDTPEGFAVKFMRGDVVAARSLFDNFFDPFVEIKKWIRGQHRASLDHGKVYTLLGDPMDVDMPYQALGLTNKEKDLLADDVYTTKVSFSEDWKEDRLLRKKIAKAFRNAQNYPIQSLSSLLAGLGISYMTEFMRENGMTSRVDCFTHDSGDIDAQMADVPTILSVLPDMSVNRIREEFGVSTKTDVEIGISANTMIELKKVEISGSVISGGFKAKKHALAPILDKLTRYKVDYDYVIEEAKVEKSSVKDLFQPKKAYSINLGQPKEIVEGKIVLDFSNVVREHV